MINIYKKNSNELAEEQSLYDFGAHIAKGIANKACETYLIKKDGTKVDTRDLTEEEILNLIELDLRDFLSPQGSYKTSNRPGLDTFKLLDTLENVWNPSYDAMLRLYGMQNQYGSIVTDLIGTIDKKGIRNLAQTIATFQKESNGDFSDVSLEEVITVIEQLSYNEQMRKQNSRSR